MTSAMRSGPYHHGNLRQALIDAGMADLRGGADLNRISLRGLAAAVGVSPTAVYRHFQTKNDLLAAIAQAGHLILAQQAQTSALAPMDSAGQARCRSLLYIRFARENPALFRLMFTGAVGVRRRSASGQSSGLFFFGQQGNPMDGHDAVRRHGMGPSAAIKTWSVAHGIAHLVLDGHLDSLDEEEVDGLIQRLVHQLVPLNRPLSPIPIDGLTGLPLLAAPLPCPPAPT